MGILEHISDERVVISEARKRLRKALGAEAALESRQVLRIGELPLHCELYESQVDAPLLIFLPGIGTYSELYAQMFDALCQQGFNVLSIDLPGHGYSGGPRGMYTVEQVCQCVTEVLDTVEARYSGPVYLFGYSIGALLAVAAGERDSRISKVICGTLLMTELPPDLFHYMGWQWTWGSGLLFPNMKMPLSVMVDFHQLLAGHPAGELINEDPLLVLDYPFRTLSSLFGHRSGVMQHSFPFELAIVQGEKDEILSLGYSRRVQYETAQKIELITVPGEGHMMPLTAPLKLAGVVADWLHNNH